MSGPLTPEQPRRDQVVKDFIQEAERLGTALKSGRIRRWFKGNGPKPTLEYDPETYHEKQRRFWAIEGTGFYVSLRGTVAYRPLDHRPVCCTRPPGLNPQGGYPRDAGHAQQSLIHFYIKLKARRLKTGGLV